MKKIIKIIIITSIIIGGLITLIICLIKKKKSTFIHNKYLDIAVIVEPRKDKYLKPVIENVFDNIDYIKIQLFHGTENLEFINKKLGRYIKNGRLILTNLGVSNLTIDDYNKLLTSKLFWNKINGENILIFQTDTCLCHGGIYKIPELLKYDYVGAPWKWQGNGGTGGNGGLSFRKKSKMLEVCDQYKGGPEDVFFSSQKSFNYPPRNVAKNFFIEGILGKQPIGVHKPWKNQNKSELVELYKVCPELKTIFKDKLSLGLKILIGVCIVIVLIILIAYFKF